MLATYPEVFAGGAIIAGLPYGCANNVQQAFELMFTAQTQCARALGDRVRAASPHRGPWPKISVWHGTGDPIVQPSNGEDIIRQWTDVHSLTECPSYQESIGGHTRRIWSDANGDALIEAFSIIGMAHGVPLATTGGEICGAAGAFFLDAGISSTHHIARFWQLDESFVGMPRAASASSVAIQIPTEALVGAPATDSHLCAEGSQDEQRQIDYPLDPNVVIAAAFRAAGLPVPEIPATPPGAIAPGPIIAAALKAARRLSN
jgi:feruloyl esterase